MCLVILKLLYKYFKRNWKGMVFGLFCVGFDAQEFGARPLGGLLARLADSFANLKSAPVPVAGFLGGIFRV